MFGKYQSSIVNEQNMKQLLENIPTLEDYETSAYDASTVLDKSTQILFHKDTETNSPKISITRLEFITKKENSAGDVRVRFDAIFIINKTVNYKLKDCTIDETGHVRLFSSDNIPSKYAASKNSDKFMTSQDYALNGFADSVRVKFHNQYDELFATVGKLEADGHRLFIKFFNTFVSID